MINKLALKRARVNIKSLAAEARIIRSEIKKSKDSWHKSDLHEHRMRSVRPEARLANLAIAYIKGNPRKTVEITEKPVDLKRFFTKLQIFFKWTHNMRIQLTIEDVKTWLES